MLPAVAMPNAAASAAYLLAFAFGTALAMAVFTALVGVGGARVSRSPLVLRWLICGAGVVAMLVGVFWLAAPLAA